MKLIVQQCSNKQNCSSHIFAYVKKGYTNIELHWVVIIFYAFYDLLYCSHKYKQTKDKKIINRKTSISKTWAF